MSNTKTSFCAVFKMVAFFLPINTIASIDEEQETGMPSPRISLVSFSILCSWSLLVEEKLRPQRYFYFAFPIFKGFFNLVYMKHFPFFEMDTNWHLN